EPHPSLPVPPAAQVPYGRAGPPVRKGPPDPAGTRAGGADRTIRRVDHAVMLPGGAAPAWLVAAAAPGAAAGPALRARIFRHAVPFAQRVRDACPHCGRRLVPPGWRGLRAVLPPSGRCPGCRHRVGPPPGTVEAVAAVAFAALAAVGGSVLETAALWWVAAAGVALAFIDVAVHRLPDRLTLTGYAGALVLLGTAAVTGGRLG